jgi:5'-3' exoribonuclease 2
MGVPALFRWLSQKYPKIISPVIEDHPTEVEGEKIPIDARKPNPNGEEFDNLYLDMNGIVHPCSHPEDRPPPETEEDMMLAVFEYTERVVNMVRPRKLLMIAVDGVAPRAKMNQQRSRRFRAAQEAAEKDRDKEEFYKMLRAQGKEPEGGDSDGKPKKTWDSNAITPGTPFMDILAASLRYWCSYKLNTDPAWENLKVIISDATVPGEGEHKIMQFVRSQRSSPQHDPNTRHVMYGLDADLIMLGLATHEPHFRILREDVFANDTKPGCCRICNQPGHMAAECKGKPAKKEGDFGEKQGGAPLKPFIWLHVGVLREYLAVEMSVPNQPFRFDLERALDDWVFMCFFVGNDFLPHLPSLDIREQGIDTLIAIWRDNIPTMGGYVTKDGHVDLARAQLILEGLAKQEDTIFKRRKEVEERKDAAAKRRAEQQNKRARRGAPNGGDAPVTPAQFMGSRKRGEMIPDINALPTFNPATAQTASDPRYSMTHDMVVNKANVANKSAAAVLKEKLLAQKNGTAAESQKDAVDQLMSNAGVSTETSPTSVLGKRKAEDDDDNDAGTPGRNSPVPTPAAAAKEPEGPPEDTVMLWESGYADRYYEQKFKVPAGDIAFRHQVARDYVEGLAWVLLYYFQGCASWTWYYPHHYAPFAADFVDLKDMTIDFKKGKPFRPYEQLMGVMPARSNHVLPAAFHPLMTDEDSDIIDFYPEDFVVDLNGKKFAWQGIALLPFIDSKRLLDAMATKYPLLTEDEHSRNAFGHDALIFSSKHQLYDDVATNFYSKKAGAPNFELNPKVSDGLAGKVEKNEDYLPSSSLTFPLPGATPFQDIDDDQSIAVHYVMPPANHVHKSMLLPGLIPPKPVLDYNDIESTRQKSQKSGRQFGGAPLYEQGGRGGRVDYSGGGGRGGYDNNNNGGSYNNGYSRGGRGGGGGGYNNGPPRNDGYGRGNGSGGYGGPPPPPGGFQNLPPGLAAQAAAHFGRNGGGGLPPPPPPGWMPGMAAPPPQYNQGGYGADYNNSNNHNNGGGYNHGGGYGGGNGQRGRGGRGGGGGRGRGGYDRY